jgi:hypothetical protein
MIDLETATRLMQNELDNLPYEGKRAILLVEEYPCGWVFYWDSAEYVATKNPAFASGGNVPYLVIRFDGAMYSLGPMRNRYDPNRYPEGLEALSRVK